MKIKQAIITKHKQPNKSTYYQIRLVCRRGWLFFGREYSVWATSIFNTPRQFKHYRAAYAFARENFPRVPVK